MRISTCVEHRNIRTVSLLVVAVAPIDHFAITRQEVWRNSKKLLYPYEARLEARAKLCWTQYTRGRFTARLILCLAAWVERKFGEVSNYMTQFLTSHRPFQANLHKLVKVGSPSCIYWGKFVDDNHTCSEWDQWAPQREQVKNNIGSVSSDNLVDKFRLDEQRWMNIYLYHA